MFATLRKRHVRQTGSAGPAGIASGSHGSHGAPLPALSICRLEAPEELLKKLRRHADDPALAEFTCPICWEPFWQPVRTVCGHAFCEGCLLKSVLAQLGHDQPDVSCPLCRHPLHVDDVSADEALLTRIRLVIAQKNREIETPGTGRACSGRLFRGSTRSPNLETPGMRTLHCTGHPCTPAPVELLRAQTSGATKRPILASWMRVAPSDELRPATSGCGRFQGMNELAEPSPLFVQSSFVARPSTTGAWTQSRSSNIGTLSSVGDVGSGHGGIHNGENGESGESGALAPGTLRRPITDDIPAKLSKQEAQPQQPLQAQRLHGTQLVRLTSKESKESKESRESRESSRTAAWDPEWIEELACEVQEIGGASAPSSLPTPAAVSSQAHVKPRLGYGALKHQRAAEKHLGTSLPPPRLARSDMGMDGIVPAPRTARRRACQVGISLSVFFNGFFLQPSAGGGWGGRWR